MRGTSGTFACYCFNLYFNSDVLQFRASDSEDGDDSATAGPSNATPVTLPTSSPAYQFAFNEAATLDGDTSMHLGDDGAASDDASSRVGSKRPKGGKADPVKKPRRGK